LVEEPAGDPVLTMQAADHPRSIAEAATNDAEADSPRQKFATEIYGPVVDKISVR